GRVDDQVKVRGFRIEPGEIASVLGGHEWVQSAYVQAVGEGADKQLVGYVVASSTLHELHEIEAALFARLANILPHYMQLERLIWMTAMPLSKNGKVDRKALPSFDSSKQRSDNYIPPRNDFETKIADVWEEVLKTPQISMTDNFFSLGGNSILAIRAATMLSKKLSITIGVNDLLECNTIEELAKLTQQKEFDETLFIPKSQGVGPMPLSFAQQRLWFIEQLETNSTQYNMSALIRLSGQLDEKALNKALNAIVERHQVLRTNYHSQADGSPVQMVQPMQTFEVEMINLTALCHDVAEQKVSELSAKEAHKAFDLTQDIMLRATLIALAPEQHVLIFTMHHIASDGWSMGIMVSEFSSLYRAFLQGLDNPLTPLSIQYADFAQWQHHFLKNTDTSASLGYWSKQLADLPKEHSLALDHPRMAHNEKAGASLIRQLPARLNQELGVLSESQNCTLFTTLQTAFGILLSRYSGKRDIVIGTPTANRLQADVSPLIGFFVNTLVLRTQVNGELNFKQLLSANKRVILDAFAHQHIPFDMLVDVLQPQRSLLHSPLFQIMFAMNDQNDRKIDLPGLRVDVQELALQGNKFDLLLRIEQNEFGMATHWHFNPSILDESTISRLSESFQILLESIVDDVLQNVSRLPIISAVDQQIFEGIKYTKLPSERLDCLSKEKIVRWEIRDDYANPVPVGVVGELWVFNDEFLEPALPMADGMRTGQLVKLTHDRQFIYIGQCCDQVTVSGISFNTKEIKDVLALYPEVFQTKVQMQTYQGKTYPVAYVQAKTLSGDPQYFAAQLDQWLSQHLSHEKRPAGIAITADIECELAQPFWFIDLPFEEASTETEKILAGLWIDLLESKKVSRYDNFFDIGGNSLTAIRLEFAIKQQFCVALAVKDIFEHSTLEKMSALIEAKNTVEEHLIPLVSRKQPLPLAFSQRRLWFIDQLEPGGCEYNIPMVLKINGRLDRSALQRAFNDIYARHEILRSHYVTSSSGEPIQKIQPSVPINIRYIQAEDSDTAFIDKVIQTESKYAFDLKTDLMLRVAVIVCSERENILLLTMHHIASDGWSLRVLSEEFSQLYSAYLHNEPLTLAPLTVQYADFAHWENAWLDSDQCKAHVDYWKAKLDGLATLHSLPLDKTRPAVQSYRGATLNIPFSQAVYKRLEGFNKQHEVTFFITLQSVFAVLISRFSHETDVVIGTSHANRSHSELAPLIGFFVNSLVLRSDVQPEMSFSTFLAANKLTILDAFAHQQTPFELLVEKLHPQRSLSHAPLVQVAFNLILEDNLQLTLPDAQITQIKQEQDHAKFDLSLNIMQSAQGLVARWNYSTDLFEKTTIEHMGACFLTLIQSVLSQPQVALSDCQILPQSDVERLIIDLEQTQTEVETEIVFHQLFARQVDKTPQSIALLSDNNEVSYIA
ncbi:condensation domain-containing protein, partial [Paraglaciecola sp.]|uniref:condensation domain-containing protein n=1 Tax=Paraglaciecola sp. TaxID=1920173 RepID=UPI0030F39077